MKKQQSQSQKSLFTEETNDIAKAVENDNSTNQFREYHNHQEGTGPCTVPGCGCSEYKDNDGNCWNLNAASGTCNHLASAHAK